MTSKAYNGLTTRIEIIPGERTPMSSPNDLPFYLKLVTATKERVEVAGELVYPFSARKCFEIMKDYRKFLLTHLKDNEREATEKMGKQFHAKPMWIKDGIDGTFGSVGSMVQYAYFDQGVVYWMVDKVTTLEDGEETDQNGNKIYRFAMETQRDRSVPQMPMRGHGTYMIFTTHEKDVNKCHLKWIRKFDKPYMAGIVSLESMFIKCFEGYMQRDLFILWQLYHSCYSEKLPKMDSKVLVVGAGPSGLHMTYELIKRGLAPENVTILEKDNRYGGKTLSIPSGSNVQISNAVYNPPPPKAAFIPKVRDLLRRYYTCKTIRDAIQFWLDSGSLTPEEFELIQRQNTPNALQHQEDDEYFAGGAPVFHELGTCYLSPGYYAIRTLLKEIQSQVLEKAAVEGNDQGKWTEIAAADITSEVGPDTYAIESSQWDGAMTLEQWIVYEGKKNTDWDDICGCSPATQAVAVDASVMAAKLKYCKLHNQYLGNYYYTMPPQPSDDSFEDLIVPFYDFMQANDLLTMEPLFTYALTAQGYGIIKKTPTFLAMQWLTPDLLDGYFEWYYYFGTYKNSVGQVVDAIPKDLQKFDNFRKGMLVSGWGGLWDRIVALFELDHRIKFETNIQSIKRSNGKVTAEYTHKGHEYSETFDYLIVGAPLSDPVNDPTFQTLPLDLDAEEQNLFLSKYLTASTFRTNLFLPEQNGDYSIDHLRIFIDAIMNKDEAVVGTGDVFGVRDSYKAIQPRLSTINGDKYDPVRDVPREKMCYQYVSPDNKEMSGEELLTKNFIAFMKQHPEYFNNTKGSKEERIRRMLIRFKQWTYYTHYEDDGLRQGNLWKILDLQGNKNTMFVHASTNFESVLDIVNYNNMLLDGMSGRLDDLTKPEADTRPAPWQRPQILLFERLTFNKVFRQVLNFVIFILWSIWYVVSYPFAEGFYLRWQRYNLQKAFQTPDLGSWMDYTQSKFNNVSPLVRGYMDYVKGIPNGIPNPIPEDFDPFVWDAKLGPGDTVFKIVQAPKNGFLKKHPNIPDYTEIPTSIFWNMTDMRVAIRFWLTTFDDTFKPILTPTIQNIIQTFSYYFPNYYSWIFAWSFASQFRLLIGFSYRFEDAQGGGLRIPDCSMLRTAIKDHGLEAGQRICLTICKVFTEEIMKKKKMKLDFQPDFSHGVGGTGCSVRFEAPMENAYSNHSLYESFRTDAEKKKFEKIDVSW